MHLRGFAGRPAQMAAIGVVACALAFLAALAPAATHAQSTDPVRPAPEQCVKRCDEHARAAYRQCLAAGGAEERCARAAREAAQRCREGCGKVQPPSAGGKCAKDCAVKAREAFKACVEGGGDQAACREAAVARMKACTEACPKPEPAPKPTCDDLCARAAKHAEKSCLEAGGTAESCAAAAADARAKCAERCARSGVAPRPGRP